MLPKELRKGDPITIWMHEVLEENLAILQAETDQDGNKLDILRIPVPPLTIGRIRYTKSNLDFLKASMPEEAHRVLPHSCSTPVDTILPMSYCNFLVTNGIVLMPRYFKEGRQEQLNKTDDMARDMLGQVFPDRRIVQIDTEALEYGGGGIHCSTQQQPFLKA